MRKNLSLEKIKEERKNSRIEKINSLIKKAIADVFLMLDLHNSKRENLIISIPKIVLSNDGKSATVLVETLNKNLKEEILLEIIEENSIKIKNEFSRRIDLRYTPKLKFQLFSKYYQ